MIRHFLAAIVSVLTFSQLLGAGIASATLIIDTGPGPFGGGWDLDAHQWLAAEFSLGASFTITDVQGWIGNGQQSQITGTVTAVIYTDGGTCQEQNCSRPHSLRMGRPTGTGRVA